MPQAIKVSPAFSKAADSKGRAFGRGPQDAEHLSRQKAQEGSRNNPVDCSGAGNPSEGFPVSRPARFCRYQINAYVLISLWEEIYWELYWKSGKNSLIPAQNFHPRRSGSSTTICRNRSCAASWRISKARVWMRSSCTRASGFQKHSAICQTNISRSSARSWKRLPDWICPSSCTTRRCTPPVRRTAR